MSPKMFLELLLALAALAALACLRRSRTCATQRVSM